MPLSAKQQRFVEEYLIDLNATQAYIRAGYSPNGAAQAAAKLLRKTEVYSAVQAALESKTAGMAAKLNENAVTAERVLNEYLVVALSDVGQVLDMTGTDPKLRRWNEIPESARRAIASVKVRRYLEGNGDDKREVEVTEFRFWPKTAALDSLARYLDLFGEHKPKKVDVTTDGKPIIERGALLPSDLAAIAAFLGVAGGGGLQPNGAGQSMDPGSSPPQAAAVPEP